MSHSCEGVDPTMNHYKFMSPLERRKDDENANWFPVLRSPRTPENTTLVEEPEDFPSNMLSSRLFMIHNPSTRRQNNISNTSSWQELIDPFLKIRKTDVEPGGDDTAFIETTIELNDNLARTMVIDLLEFANVALSLVSTATKKSGMFRGCKRSSSSGTRACKIISKRFHSSGPLKDRTLWRRNEISS